MAFDWRPLFIICVLCHHVKHLLALSCNISIEQMNALEAFFEATHGNEWSSQTAPEFVHSDWSFPSPLSSPCSTPWYGLTCSVINDESGQCDVESLNLLLNNLVGSIPAQISQLTWLLELDLSENNITGTFPSTFGQLTQLQNLSLNTCSLHGTIGQEITSLVGLRVLDLSFNSFSGTIPLEISNISKLVWLELDDNSLNGLIPTSIYQLSHLKQLSLGSNSLSGRLPSEVSLLGHSLSILDVSLNRLTGTIPSELLELSLLTELYLYSNSLTGKIPAHLELLPGLEQYEVNDNFFTGSLELFNFSLFHGLVSFVVGENFLDGPVQQTIPPQSPLTEFSVCCNLFTGSLELFVLTNSSIGLDVSFNYLSGSLSQQIGDNIEATLLDLSSNLFSSSLPSVFGMLTNLDGVLLSNNLFTGTFPTEIARLTGLKSLEINNNGFSGSFPSDMFRIKAITGFSINNNQLSGTIPDAVADMLTLASFDVSENQFSGTLPPKFGKRIALMLLNNNRFTGTIPPTLFTDVPMTDFYAFSNMFTGNLGFMVQGASASFDVLVTFVGDNLLTGPLPSLSSDFVFVSDLGLESNFLTGGMSAFLCGSFDPNTILLNNNFLTGSLSIEVDHLNIFGLGLQILLLGNNMLNGSISTTLSTLTAVTELDVGNNSLTGTVPQGLLNSSTLQTLVLANNSLGGNVSVEKIGSSMTHLDISGNTFNGTFPSHLGLNLETLVLSNNGFTGSLSFNCTSSRHLSSLFLGSNKFRGDLTSLRCLTNLTVLSIENNGFTGSLEILDFLTNIEQLIISANEFTGTLPSSLAERSLLKALVVSNNKLSGHPDNIFNSSVQKLLTAVDLSSNDFTGPVPTKVFELENLESFASIKTCFSGSLPSTLCACSSLKELLLDGVTSGVSCQRKFGIDGLAKSDAYISSQGPLRGGIPSCIWSLPVLVSLHLSSNGLTGTIGEVPINSNLTGIVLSYNQLSGTIPSALFGLPFTTLELSDNRLKGTVSLPVGQDNLAHNDAVVYLQNNRLSGFLPSTFTNATQLNVMEGNLIDCNSRHPKPRSDAHASETACGSDPLDVALIFWGIVAFCFVLAVLVFRELNRQQQQLQRREENLQNLESTVSVVMVSALYCCATVRVQQQLRYIEDIKNTINLPSSGQSSELCLYLSALIQMLSFQLLFFVLSLILFMPIFLILKFVEHGEYSTHTYQYQWLVSATFLTGIVPGCCLIVLWCFCFGIFVRILMNSALSSNGMDETKAAAKPYDMVTIAESELKSSRHTTYQFVEYVLFALFVCVHFVVMACINVAYLYITLSGKFSVDVMTASQVVTSAVKVLWDAAIIPRGIRVLQTAIGAASNSSGDNTILQPSFAVLRFWCSVLSSVVVPFLVSLVVNSLCFLDLFVPQSVVNENFFYNIANQVTCLVVHLQGVNVTTDTGTVTVIPPPVTDCLSFGSVQQFSTEFYPPFTYSFQCGSGILTSYVPVLIYSFTFRMLLMAAHHFWAALMYPWLCSPKSNGSELNEDRNPSSRRKVRTDSRSIGNGLLYSLVLLTFGLASPPLTAAVVLCAIIEVCWHIYLVADMSQERDTSNGEFEAFVMDVQGSWPLPVKCMWPCVHLASLFWALMVYDMVGDADVMHPQAALWSCACVIAAPCFLRGWLAWSWYFRHHRRPQRVVESNDEDLLKPPTVERNNERVRSMTESVDSTIPSGRDRTSLLMAPISSRSVDIVHNVIHDPSQQSNSAFV